MNVGPISGRQPLEYRAILCFRENYGLSNDFKYENLFSRRLEKEDTLSRSLFYANDAVKDFVVSKLAFFCTFSRLQIWILYLYKMQE